MKFDKSKVYTALDADDVAVGSKGYFADSLNADSFNSLMSLVREGCSDMLHTLTKVNTDYDFRFAADNGLCYNLFYLVEEPNSKIKEVTAAEWDNRPRLMKVWDDDISKFKHGVVTHIIPDKYDVGYPVIALYSNSDGVHSLCTYKHCAEIAATQEAKEPEAEKHYRPYNNADEFIEDYKKRFCPDCKGIPAIWVKNVADTLKMVNNIADNEVFMTAWINYSAFMDTYTYPDGTHCGMEE